MNCKLLRKLILMIVLLCLSILSACQQTKLDPKTLSYVNEQVLTDGFENLTIEEGAEKLFNSTLKLEEGQKICFIPYKTYLPGDKIEPGIAYIPAEDLEKARVNVSTATDRIEGTGFYLIKQNNEWKLLNLRIEYLKGDPLRRKEPAELVVDVDGTITSMPFSYYAIAYFIAVN